MLSALSSGGARRRLFPSLIVVASMTVTTPLHGQTSKGAPGPPVPLVPEREALFSSPDVPGSIEFRLGTNGDVTEARLDNGTSVSIWLHGEDRS